MLKTVVRFYLNREPGGGLDLFQELLADGSEGHSVRSGYEACPDLDQS